MLKRMLIVLSLILSLTISTTAQTPAQPLAGSLDKKAAKIRANVERLGVGHRITVKLKNGADHHGAISKINATDFEIAEVDLRQNVGFGYEEVRKVRDDYGRKNIFGQRVNPKTGAIVTAGVLGGLLALIVLSIPK